LFLVIKGQITIKLRDQEDIHLNEGEMVVIPKGVEHMPVAEEEAYVALIVYALLPHCSYCASDEQLIRQKTSNSILNKGSSKILSDKRR
jgi:ribosomal protein L16 Arg81 hydroxylase